MGRRPRISRRTATQTAADRASDELAGRLGKMLRDGRLRLALTQADAAGRAGVSAGTWSHLENDKDGRVTIATWGRAAVAVNSSLSAYLKETSVADQPRDAVHLRAQELLLRSSNGGGWSQLPEAQIDRDARTSRFADVLLHRRLAGIPEYGLFEVFDWFDDVGGATRDWTRRLDAVERFAIARMTDDALPRTDGCWIVRATVRNRRLVAEHSAFFLARFPGSGEAWLAALETAAPIPDESALLWISVDGKQLYRARLTKREGPELAPGASRSWRGADQGTNAR